MANLRKFQEVTSADGTAVELEAVDLPINVPLDLFITTSSDSAGTVQFQVAKKGTLVASLDWSGIKAWPASSNCPPITVRNGDLNMFYKASGAGAKFTVGY